MTLLILLGVTGAIFNGVREGGRTKLLNGLSINQDNIDEFLATNTRVTNPSPRLFLPGVVST